MRLTKIEIRALSLFVRDVIGSYSVTPDAMTTASIIAGIPKKEKEQLGYPLLRAIKKLSLN